MKTIAGILVLGVSLWLGSAYYPFTTYRIVSQIEAPEEQLKSQNKSEGSRNKMMEEAPAAPTIVRVDYYSEIKFWVEKSGQLLSGIGALGVLLKALRRKKE